MTAILKNLFFEYVGVKTKLLCFKLKQIIYLIDKLMVEMGDLQIPQASLSFFAVSR